MMKLHLWMLALMVLCCTTAMGQSMFKGGKSITPVEFTTARSDFQSLKFQDHYFLKAAFSKSLSLDEQTRLQGLGINLVKGYGNNEYLIQLSENANIEDLKKANIDQFNIEAPTAKISREIKEMEVPEWANEGNGNAKITVTFLSHVNLDLATSILSTADATILPSKFNQTNIQSAIINLTNIDQLATHPLVNAIEYQQEPEKTLMFDNRSLQRVNQIQSSISGELNLDGEGVCIGIGDGGELGEHIDFNGRVINKASGTYDSFGAHGDHVSGIIGGAGNINPWHRGIAHKSDLITQKTSLITYYLPEYVAEHNMVLTNNSYGTSSNCLLNGEYNTTSAVLDKQLLDYPEVLHVFAAGNSGATTCDGYPMGYKTVLRYYQSSKNILTVGNVTEDRIISLNSSRGPLLDGRIKPEIVGVGTSVYSTGRDYDYYSGSGTSMAAPSVTGVLGLLYQRYKQLHGGQNPSAALIKAIACNTAEDLGNAGPDYTYGFGLVSATHAEKVLEDNRYVTGSMAAGESAAHQITVPAGAGQLRVMLYWHDVEGDVNATSALVNDLDLTVSNTSQTYQPWILDPTPANVANDAVRGADHLNNIEQVTIDQPAAGTYTIDISAFDIPIGVQDYVMTYEIVEAEIEVTYPMGGEVIEPGSESFIRWNVESYNTSTFKVEYSLDNGNSWEVIDSEVAATERGVKWDVPAGYTAEGLIKVTRNSNNQEDVSNASFRIIASPANLDAQGGCARTIDLTWSPVADADHYEILMFNNDEFSVIGTTTDATYKVAETMEIGSMYWFTIRTVMASGQKSERAIAVPGIPDSNDPCDWDNDAILELPGMVKGRYDTQMELGLDEILEMSVTNVGQNELSTFTINYSINGLSPVAETFFLSLASGETTTITFTEGLDLNGVGEYTIDAWIEVPGDTNPGNDVVQSTLLAIQLDNPLIELPYTEDFNVNSYELTGYHFGIEDYNAIDVNTGATGKFELLKVGLTKVANLARTNLWEENVSFAEATINMNMANYYRTSDPVVMSFKYLGHSNAAPTGTPNGNKVLFRGSDQDEWITIHEMTFSKNWNEVNGIDLSNLLIEANQDFSSSFQIKFIQDDFYSFYIDDVYLNTASRLPVQIGTFDVQKTKIDEALVTWTTESEYNNDYFEIQVADASNQAAGFKTIGRVKGQGISLYKMTYQFVDIDPNKTGVRYYRIKQVDFDGTTAYTIIKQLLFRETVAQVSVYPNPVIKRFSLHYEAEQEETTEVRLINLAGKVIFHNPLFIPEGNHEFNFELDEHLEAGMYMLQIVHSNNRITSIPISKARD